MESEDLRNAGLKVTHPRLRILSLLEQAKPRHMTAEDIYRHLLEHGEDIGLATVYRVLTQFEAAGLVLNARSGGQGCVRLEPPARQPCLRRRRSVRRAPTAPISINTPEMLRPPQQNRGRSEAPDAA